MKFRNVLLPLIVVILAGQLSARGIQEETGDGTSAVPRIVQAGSAAFIVADALFLFPEARETVVALSDGNQGNGFFVEDLEPGVTRDKILPRSVNSESILSLNPDVVVLKNYLEGRMGKPLEQVGVETLYLDLESPEAWLEDLDKIGRLFGNTERAAELKSMVTERMAEVEEPLTGLDPSERPDTLFLYWSVRDGVSAVNVPPDGWIQTRLVEMAGGQPVWTGGENSDGWMRVNPEQVAAWNPEHIVVAAYHIPASDAVEAIRNDPLWSELDAVRNGNLYAFPGDYHSWDQPDIRWLLGLRWLASCLQPDYFPEMDKNSDVRQFYSDFFFLDDETYDRMIAPRLTGLD